MCSAFGCKDFEALIVELLSDVSNFIFILITNRDEDAAFALDGVTGSNEAFIKGFEEGLTNTKHFTGGFHFRPELGINIGQLFKGEYWYFDSDVFACWINAGAVAKIGQLFTEADTGGKINHRNPGYLTDVRDGA